MSAYRVSAASPRVLELRADPLPGVLLLVVAAILLAVGGFLVMASFDEHAGDIIVLGALTGGVGLVFARKGLAARGRAARFSMQGAVVVVEARKGRQIVASQQVRADDIVDIVVTRARGALNDLDHFGLELRLPDDVIYLDGFAGPHNACEEKRDELARFLRA